MRISSTISQLLFAALLVALPLPRAFAAPPVSATAAPTTGAATKPAGELGSGKVKIAPHRAIYDMALASVKNGSNITGVSGRMMFEWSDVCDGWAVQQHLQLHFSYAQGDESDVTSTVVSWESKDGKRYNFNVRRVSDGKETDLFRGKAVMGADGGTVTYSSPKDKTMKLSADTIFPSAHTEMLIRKALSSERLFTRRVFDGSDEDGINDISAFIGPEIGQVQNTQLGEKLKNNPLLAVPGWPVRMAFFKINTETGEPDYEMNLTLLANGVARSMVLDYGDFVVSGTLSNIEALPAAGCQE